MFAAEGVFGSLPGLELDLADVHVRKASLERTGCGPASDKERPAPGLEVFALAFAVAVEAREVDEVGLVGVGMARDVPA